MPNKICPETHHSHPRHLPHPHRHAPEHPHRGTAGLHRRGREATQDDALPARPDRSTRNWSGRARTSRTRPTWPCRPCRSTSRRTSSRRRLWKSCGRRPTKRAAPQQPMLFADFNGLPFEERVDFYHHDQHWTNRMVLGNSLLVMTSLAEKEGLKGKVQMIYLDPPYGIKFGSNWQV